jgi:signal transduction histidine kinase
MSDAPTPPWGIRVDDGRNEYADGIERLQTRLLHIGLFLLTVVMLGGGAGVLMVVTEDSRAVGVSIAVVAGCVVAVLVALLTAMSATRRLTALARRPQPVALPRPAPLPAPAPVLEPLPAPDHQLPPEAAPLWSRPGEQQVTLTDDPSQRREVFVKLARRLQSLINRAIKRIDELEQDNEDPELLDGLYEIDHLFTLARRQGENLAVLGGEAPQRRSNKPVSVYAVLLAAVSEAEHYRQIAIVPVEDVEIHGHAVAEIIHLLAELLENATRFTSPDGPKVEVRAHRVTAGLAIEVQDRGLGMSHEDLERINHLLDGSTRIDLSELLEDGRIGLAVVRELARRHHIRVRLQSNIFGGIAAAVVIPPQLLSETERESRHHAGPQRQRQSALPKRKADTENATHTVTTVAERPAQLPPAEPSRPQEPVVSRPVPREPAASARPSTPVTTPPPTAVETSGPVQVPAPMPIPSAATQSSPGLGPIRPGTQTRQRTEPGAEEDLPVLATRAPGRSYDDLRAGGDGVIVEDMGADKGNPPPLPQRRGSHLREELLEPPSPTKPVPGHNPSLMKTVQAGRENWFAEQDREANKNRGDSWPTT